LRSIEQELAEKGTGSTFSAISGSVLRDQIITLAPYNEQLRIVEAIETQFTRIDEGVKLLQRLRDNLKRYKAAVLKAACEGRLVPQDPDDEPASELLKRILHERRAQWQAEGRKGKYVEPQPPDTTDLPDLPDGWVWATTNQLASTDKYSLAIGPFGSNLMVKDYRDEGIPLVFVKEIRSGIFERKGLPRITLEKAEELRSHHVHPGDLVITKMGEPPGDVAIFPDHIPLAVATSDCIKWTLSPHLRNRRYFMFAMRFPVVKSQILQITRGVAQLKMSLERFKGLNIPVPPIEEQERIVTYIDEIFSIADEVNLQITSSLQRAEHLRQSILKQAFEGRLVPQDPNDEPASVLLRHIQASRKQGRGKR
ncbi:MAG: restriction endonuclease subunit S, partial [Candidatus Methanoperedens sp.]|nr:restriction endonuclease subunit S [Candidatus Methanoperedens sp.]